MNGTCANTANKSGRLAQIAPAVDPSTHEVVSAAVSLNSVNDSQVLPELLNSSCCDEIKQVAPMGWCLRCQRLLSSADKSWEHTPRSNPIFWEEGHSRNNADTALKYGQLEKWQRWMKPIAQPFWDQGLKCVSRAVYAKDRVIYLCK